MLQTHARIESTPPPPPPFQALAERFRRRRAPVSFFKLAHRLVRSHSFPPPSLLHPARDDSAESTTAKDQQQQRFLHELHSSSARNRNRRSSSSKRSIWGTFSRPQPATFLSALVVVLVIVIVQLVSQSPYLFRPFPAALPPTCPAPNAFVQELYCRAPQHTPRSLFGRSPRSMALARAAERVAAEFEYSQEDVNRGVREFIREMDEGLNKSGTTMSQIPTYVTAVPNGTEQGLYMAVDLGGTNFRVCSIQLHGNSTFSLTQSKVAIPKALMQAKTSRELFAFLARQIETFLKTHHGEQYQSHKERRRSIFGGTDEQNIFSLGFTFSFPVHQVGINKGTLIRWTKGFDIPDAIGKDVCALLQAEIDALGLPVRVAALVNDTVGTLMARSYTSPGKTGTLLGAIFGTGTNGAYVEKLSRITKLQKTGTPSTGGDMIVNTEWGSFDNALSVLPNTPYDASLDRDSVNPGIQMFEKRVSGMFLGEILRRALLKLLDDPAVPLFHDEDSHENDIHSTTTVAPDSPLYKQWGLDTSFLSITSGDHSAGLKATRQALDRDYGVSAPSAEDAEAVRLIAVAIGKRAARLAAVAIAAVVLSTGKLAAPADLTTTNSAALEVNEDEGIVDIGVDGSLVEFYPRFEDFIREALREIPGIGAAGEKRIRIGIAKDGSGVGAALIALVADRARKGVVPDPEELIVAGGDGEGEGSSFAGWLRRVWRGVERDVRIRV